MQKEQTLERIHVLLVDNDPKNLKYMEELFTSKGHYVQVAPNGIEALRIIQEGTYHVIVTDVIMPLMNGIELAKAIGAYLPIVMFDATQEHLSDNVLNYCDCFIEKEELNERLYPAVFKAMERFYDRVGSFERSAA